MTTYEKVVDGRVVERVTPVEGDHEDTRLGCLVLDGDSEWRIAGATPVDEQPATPQQTTAPKPRPTAPKPKENP